MKRVVKIIVFILIFASIAVGAYYLWAYYQDRSDSTPNIPINGDILPSPSPINNGMKLQPLGGPELSGYFLKNGVVIGVGLDGAVVSIHGREANPLNNATFNEEILEIIPSFNGEWFLEKWGSGKNPRFSLYNTPTNTWLPFTDLDLLAMDFAPDSSRLAYLEGTNRGVNLSIMDLIKKDESSGFVRNTVSSFALQDVELSWVTSDTIFISEKPSARVPGSLWQYTVSTKRLEPLMLEENGLWIKWDKSTGYGIKFSSAPNKQLTVVNTKGTPITESLLLTFPDKCVTTADTLYCAVPKTSLAGKDLPDDYLKHLFYTNDAIYKVDLKKGFTDRIFSSFTTLDAVNLKIIENRLYFINRYNNQLYQINI